MSKFPSTIDINGPSVQRALKAAAEKGIQPPIGASPGELRLWLRQHNIDPSAPSSACGNAAPANFLTNLKAKQQTPQKSKLVKRLPARQGSTASLTQQEQAPRRLAPPWLPKLDGRTLQRTSTKTPLDLHSGPPPAGASRKHD